MSHALFLLRNLRKSGLKGNRVQIPDSPAAVSFKTDWAILFMPLTRVGKALIPEVSQKTCNAYFFDGFEDRPEENCEAVGFLPFFISVSVAIYLFFNYFAIIIGKRGMNLWVG